MTSADRDLTLDQAAALLGLSREGVRSRLRRGLLRGERRGSAWYVLAVSGQPVTVTPADRVTGPDQPDRPDRPDRPRRAAARSALVARLEADVAFLQAEVERRDRELEHAAVERAELRRLLAAALPALPAGAPETAENRVHPVVVAENPRRRWWRVWRR